MIRTKIELGLAGFIVAGIAYGSGVELIQGYQDVAGGAFSVTEGRTAWLQEHQPSTGADARSCATCHGKDLSRPGRHVKTGKPIEPMALSVNPTRLSDPKKVEKWFRRNCRWTLGRECTSQEKGNFIRFITTQ